MNTTGAPRTVESAAAAELEGITKTFYGAIANDRVDLTVPRGQVHALLGENGAGKTTLCSILAGMYRPDAGRITIDGVEREFRSPADALAAGVGMVYQHFKLVPSFTVAENIILGQPSTARKLNTRAIAGTVHDLMERYGISVNADAQVGTLTVGEQQRVEILKLLHRGVQVLILDEPTAVLTPQEADVLFTAVQELAAEGRAIIFISHKLNEVLAVSSQVTVLRDGLVVATFPTSEADEHTLARLMVDRSEDVEEIEIEANHERAAITRKRSRPAAATPHDDLRLTVREIDVADDRQHLTVRGLSIAVGRGEIVGLAGVAGNGQLELAEAIAGLRPTAGGSITIDGVDVTETTVRERVEAGLAFIPEDRMSMGVASGLDLDDNLLLRSYWRRPNSQAGVLMRHRVTGARQHAIEHYGIRGARAGFPIRILSGGNIQRAILARELAGDPGVIVAASPCRGLDVHAAMAIREVLVTQSENGAGVLLISEDLDELLALSDRIQVIYEGKLVADIWFDDATPERLGLLMAGVAA